MSRTRADLCPGAFRPWPADDGLLVRLRLIGGRVSVCSLRTLAAVAEEHGDGRVHVTRRANLQVRGFSGLDGGLTPAALRALQATGLLPTRTHELVRNVLASPGFDDALLDELDRRLCADPVLADLSARFLFVLDDGRGELMERSCDLGLVVLGPAQGQLRIGDRWGAVVPLAEAPARLAAIAHDFVLDRGTGPDRPWHVVELPQWSRVPETADSRVLRHTTPAGADPRLPEPSGPLPYDEHHRAVPEQGLDRAAIETLTAGLDDADRLIVTPWHGLLVPTFAEERA